MRNRSSITHAGLPFCFLLAICICTSSAAVSVQYVNSAVGYPTAGGVTVTIFGAGFSSGSSVPSVRIGSTTCSQPVVTLTRISCKLGAFAFGAATGLVVEVAVGTASGTTDSFKYDAPFVASVSSPRPTLGGLVTVIGSNFGISAAAIINIGSTECASPTALLPHTAITCLLSPLIVLPSYGLMVRITISNQTGSVGSFSYDSPSIDSVSTIRPTSGGIRVTCLFPGFQLRFNFFTLPILQFLAQISERSPLHPP
jgi:hypothetical protein